MKPIKMVKTGKATAELGLAALLICWAVGWGGIAAPSAHARSREKSPQAKPAPAKAAAAEAAHLKVQVKGMTCPFCAYGLDKRLRKLEGVERSRIEVDKGEAWLELKKGAAIQPDQIAQAVKKEGFTPGAVEYHGPGRLEKTKKAKSGWAFYPAGSSQEFAVKEGYELQKLRESAEQQVLVTGTLQVVEHEASSAGFPMMIEIREIR